MSEPLTKVDSAVQGLSSSPKDTKSSAAARRASSAAASGVYNIKDLEEQKIEIEIAKETQRTGWKVNTSPSTVEDKEVLKKLLTTPPIKKIDLHFPLGLEVTARNLKGVTIKDAMDAIHKAYKKRADDELDQPYLAGFEWDKEECWTRFIVHLSKDSGVQANAGGKKKKKAAAEDYLNSIIKLFLGSQLACSWLCCDVPSQFLDDRLTKRHFRHNIRSEAVPGALPIAQNSPQKPPHGLYAEKLSGTAFTAPRNENKQSWLYRILPSCAHPPFRVKGQAGEHDVENQPPTPPITPGQPLTPGQQPQHEHKDEMARFAPLSRLHYIPNQLRWDPFDHDPQSDFVSGLHLIAGAGEPTLKHGIGMFVYAAGKSMSTSSAFYSADGDLLIVAQSGVLDIRTELGWLLVRPLEIAVIPRGIRFQVLLPEGTGPARGYALELYQGHFALPELGPIGSNGLANARDFQAPVACFSEDHGPTAFSAGPSAPRDGYEVTAKFNNTLFATRQAHTPFDVVAWHGNYYPFKYDLGRFNTIGAISYDHPDPSIFTVLTAPSDHAGTAVADFVIFPPRWLVGEDTFRPPWYHRNTMSEFMGLITGDYDAKKGGKGGFVPGGASLHNVMSGHGPDAASYEGAREAELKPAKVGAGSCAFMFESCFMVGVTDWGLRTCQKVQEGYSQESWGGVKTYWKRPEGASADVHLLK
uniref:homogentisate 1,2-dioxygenase n=1 Tax=Pyricularia oryzae (strain P131) TaxID=1143193 RepID=L7JL17_PYRO1